MVQTWVPFHNRTWTVRVAGEGSVFMPYTGDQIERICAVQHARVVGNDNCVAFERRQLQIPQAAWRYSFAKYRVTVYEHLDSTLSLGHGPHTLGCYTADGVPLVPVPARARTGPRLAPEPGDTSPHLRMGRASMREPRRGKAWGPCRLRLDTPLGCPQGHPRPGSSEPLIVNDLRDGQHDHPDISLATKTGHLDLLLTS